MKNWNLWLSAIVIAAFATSSVEAKPHSITRLSEANRLLASNDFQGAAERLEPLAEHGDADARCELADLYEHGEGVAVNHEKALALYEEVVFDLHDQPNVPLLTPTHLTDKEFSQVKSLANKGDAVALNELGFLYQAGIKVTKDSGKAEELYLKSSAQGDANAMNNLAVLYLSDETDTEKYPQVLTLLTTAADKQDYDAMVNLGYLYAMGIAVEKNWTKASELFIQAAAHKSAPALFNLGYLYQRGWGVTKDLSKSEILYAKAKLSTGADFERCIGFMGQTAPASSFIKKTASSDGPRL